MVTVSATAQQKLREVLVSQSSQGATVRVGVVRGPHGCIHGWKLSIEQAGSPDDIVFRQGDLRLVADPDLEDALAGASIDYREDALGIGFTINAPNAPPPMHEHGRGCQH